MKYRKKPIIIEAIQLNRNNWEEVCYFTKGTINSKNPAWSIGASEASDTCGEPGPLYIAIKVTTAHGDQAIVRHGDWIISDSKPGTFYPCKPDVFENTYESLNSERDE